jgi:uncharacterized protein YcfJ
MMGIRSLLCVIFVAVAICGCTTVQKGAAVGAAGGAGVGAIVGHQSGHTGEGALIGAGAGALAGALIGDAIEQNKQEKVTKSCLNAAEGLMIQR